jgi:hypothetical protein
MSDQSNPESVEPIPLETESGASKPEDQLDLAGENILSLLHQATDLAGGNSRHAVGDRAEAIGSALRR